MRHQQRKMQDAARKRVAVERKRVREAEKAARKMLIRGVKLPHGTHPSWYEEYLRTPHWRTFKLRYRRSDRPQACVICDDPRYELHHRSYDNIGAEQLDDVVTLCRAHHARAHQNVKKGIPLRDAHLS